MELLHSSGLHGRRNQRRPDYLISIELGRYEGYILGPGQTQFTRMPFFTCWFDKARVKATIAPLVEV